MSLTVAIDDTLFSAMRMVSGPIGKAQTYSYTTNCLSHCLLLQYDPQVLLKISHNVQWMNNIIHNTLKPITTRELSRKGS